MVAHVNFKFLTQAPAFPVRKKIPIVVKVRAASQVNISHQHSAKMADVAHSIARGSDSGKKFDGSHHDHKNSHGNCDRQRKYPHLAVWHHDSHRQQHAVDRPRSSYRRYQSRPASVRIDQKFYDDVNDSRAYSAYEKISVEAPRAPGMLQVSAEHREVQQVEKNVENAAVKENIGERLPDSETAYDRPGAEPEPADPKSCARFVKEERRNCLQEKNGNADDANRLDGARKVPA